MKKKRRIDFERLWEDWIAPLGILALVIWAIVKIAQTG